MRGFRCCVIVRGICGLALAVCVAPSSDAQNAVESAAQHREWSDRDPRVRPGKLIAKGQNTTPAGPLKLLTYKLEEVVLPQPVEIGFLGAELGIKRKRETVESALRLTITGERVMGTYLIWIDDASVPGVWLASPTEIATFIADRSILRDSAVISIFRDGEMYELPERLKLPAGFKAPPKPVPAGNTYSIRSVLRVTDSVKQPLVQIEFRTPYVFPVRNAAYTVQIGKKVYSRLGMNKDIVVLSLTHDEFRQLRDGDRMAISVGIVNYGGSGHGVWYFGTLDKSLLDR